MAISMLKIRRPSGRLIFNMGIAIPGKSVILIETAPWIHFIFIHFFLYQILCTLIYHRHSLYSFLLSSNCRRCVIYKDFCKILKLKSWQIFLICNFDFVLLWLGIWYESIVWVFSEWWLSSWSCSTFYWHPGSLHQQGINSHDNESAG